MESDENRKKPSTGEHTARHSHRRVSQRSHGHRRNQRVSGAADLVRLRLTGVASETLWVGTAAASPAWAAPLTIPWSSVHGQAARHADDLSGDEAGVVAREAGDDAR